MTEDLIAADDRIIVKIFDVDKAIKTTSEGGLYTGNVLNPLMDLCQIGMCVSVGKNIRYIKDSEIVLFSWMLMDSDDNYLGKDDEAEYRYVTEKQIYGIVKNNKKGYSHIIPKKNYVMAMPIGNDFEDTKRGIFQIPIAAINPDDSRVKKMQLKVNDWILCLPYSAVQISVQRQWFWFIHLDDILIVNRGEHKINAYRKYVSQIIKQGSRKELVKLN